MTTINDATQAFLAAPPGLLIDGESIPALSGETFESVDPSTEEVIAHLQRARAEDVDAAVRSARRAFEPGSAWRRMTPADRGRVIHRIGDLILENADELAMLEAIDSGKVLSVARSSDVVLTANMFHYMAGWATKTEGHTMPFTMSSPDEYVAYTRSEPVGVVAGIIPWNFPLVMASWKIGPALATGCTIVLKPAEQTPLSALRLGQLVVEAGVPAGVVNILTGYGHEAGAALAAHPGVDKIAFTGSTEVGRLIVGAAVGNLKRVSLELGGKSPNIVFDDADLDIAIPGAAQAIFFHQGQCCNAGSRLFVHRKVYDEVIEGVAEIARGFQVGPVLDPESTMGPLISSEQLERVCGYVRSGQDEGATALTGGNRPQGKGYFLEPTVLADTTGDMKVVREEIFGPVVVAIPFEDPDELVRQANDTPFGLAAGVFTRDLNRAHRTAQLIQAGTVWVNTYGAFDAAIPFGGFKQSGWGREMGREVLDHYIETKSVVIRLS
ncbi:aldehyde dehydrogenase family protein [Nocardioides terrisoli]|uniref:aldehyde dehydrogenase family protein n=1 Tax=Nocardioides terrisoli TaxID=3388267 RepID=UPI00287B77C2|nr:aldehyde dehydrogenase family protein [Nocardioides marmorisolisilvae]